ncbi:hypothetical protein AVEN_117337-1 [Araneus ventricosus]|uniref:Uncharacterized protein n=1 Tax=Araneus ventricosus TaxID=182803 RepID=A0A4Y2VDD7_ARAVE|nr:hypothetical protein AVEN_169079-1 [Araneus ventricosus]GBO28503.1 hypothetical protein AVEN_117337-1 [Araneus ventricosus]
MSMSVFSAVLQRYSCGTISHYGNKILQKDVQVTNNISHWALPSSTPAPVDTAHNLSNSPNACMSEDFAILPAQIRSSNCRADGRMFSDDSEKSSDFLFLRYPPLVFTRGSAKIKRHPHRSVHKQTDLFSPPHKM